MSSESTPIPHAAVDEGDNLLDLHQIFQHPAGLRTARFIVSSFLKASSNNTNLNTDGLFSSVSLPFLGSDGSSSEAGKILRDLLAFKDTDEERGANTGRISTTLSGVRQSSQQEISATSAPAPSAVSWAHTSDAGVVTVPTASRSKPSYHQLLADIYAAESSDTHSPTNEHTSFQSYNAPNTYSSVNFATGPPQPRNGTDSPYRVESPFRAEGESNPPPVSRSSSKPQSPAFSTLRQETNQYNLDHPLDLTTTSSGYSNVNQSTGDWVVKDTMSYITPAPRLPGRPLPHKSSSASSAGRAGARELPSIKSFLPVNKGGDGHNMLARKEPHMLTLTTNRRLVPNSLDPAEHAALRASELGRSSNFSLLADPHNSLTDASQRAEIELANANKKSKKRKSKGEADGALERKKKVSEKPDKAKRVPKVKQPKPEPARYRIGLDLWMRILEFTPPSFIRKARLLNKEFFTLVQTYQSIYLNQRLENYGPDMPPPLPNVTEKQYNDLLSGKGCMEYDCSDSKASRTHWSWEVRLCQACWKSKIEREDRLQKMWQNQLTRNGINRLLECIPVGMHDSYMKPHDYIEDVESRPRGAPRLYRYHFKADVEKIVEEYEALKAPPFQENPEHSAAEKASALAAHAALETEFVAKRAEFLEQRKAKNDEHMKRVVKIETCIRDLRVKVAKPHDANRNARKERFKTGAENELPHIPMQFVKRTKAYKAAVRIFRDPGSERGWQLLKPKIELEWEQSEEKKGLEGKANGGNMDDTTTRETSVADESEQTPDPTSDHLHQIQGQDHIVSHGLHANHQHFHNMAIAQRNELFLRANELNQFRPTSYHPGMNQAAVQGYQPQSVPASLMLHTAPYSNEAMNRNDFGMSGSALQLPSGYVSYSTFPTGNNFANFPGNSASQASNTQIPIDSLLNGPSSNVPHDFDPWAGS